MKRGFPRSLLTAALFAFSPFAAPAQSQTNLFVLPREVAHVFGESMADPFFGPQSVEQIYAASEFLSLPSDVILIRGIAFRLDQRTSEGPLNTTFERVQMRMDVFEGSMQEVVEGKTGFPGLGGVTVYARTNVTLKGEVRSPEAFDIRFTFQAPFRYDRRRGQLALEISARGSSVGFNFMDAHPNYEVPGDPSTGPTFDRGAYIVREPFGGRGLSMKTLVTQFMYSPVPVIESIKARADTVEIEFAGGNDLALIQAEEADDVSGPYTTADDAQLTIIEENRMRAIVPLRKDANRFFRIRF